MHHVYVRRLLPMSIVAFERAHAQYSPLSPPPLSLTFSFPFLSFSLAGHRGKTLWKRKRARRKKSATYVCRKRRMEGRRRKADERQKSVAYKKGNNNLLRRTCITTERYVRYALRPINVISHSLSPSRSPDRSINYRRSRRENATLVAVILRWGRNSLGKSSDNSSG